MIRSRIALAALAAGMLAIERPRAQTSSAGFVVETNVGRRLIGPGRDPGTLVDLGVPPMPVLSPMIVGREQFRGAPPRSERRGPRAGSILAALPPRDGASQRRRALRRGEA